MNEIVDDNPGDVSNYPAPMTGTPRLIKFLRTALQNPEHDDLFQEVLNLGYTEWQRPERENTWGFADMTSWMEENFGNEAALITMLGKFNQQVCNGGIIQWLDNGYASDNRGRKRQRWGSASPEMDLSLLDWMINDLENSALVRLPHGHEILQILVSIQNEIEDASGPCDHCHNHRYVKCDTCGGYGKADDETCDACEGEGEIDGAPCENCGGKGYVDSNGECEECGGEGEVPCPDCNEDGQLEMDAREGSLNNLNFDRLERVYYSINDAWEQEITGYLRSLVRSPQGGGLLSRAQAFKATEKLMAMLNRLLESIDDEDTEGDVSSYQEPTLPPAQDIVNTFEDYQNDNPGPYDRIARRVASEYNIDVYDVANAFAEMGDEEMAQDIIESME